MPVDYREIVRSGVLAEEEQFTTSMHVARKVAPDAFAKAVALSDRTGLPADIAHRNFAEAEAREKQSLLDPVAFRRDNPNLFTWLQDPNNARVAHDDLDALSGLEKILTAGRDVIGSAAKGIVGSGAGTTLSGFGELYNVGASSLMRPLAAILPDPAVDLLNTEIPWWLNPAEILRRPGRDLKRLGEWMGVPQERQTLATDVAEGVGQLGFQVAAYLMTGGASSTSMLFAQGADIMAEKTAGDAADPALRDTAIIGGGAITALTERYGLDKILSRVPPNIRNRTLRFIADKLAAGGIEAAQELTEGLLHDVSRRVLTNKDAPVLDGIGREMTAAGAAAGLVRTALGVRGLRHAQQTEDFITALGDNAKASKLRERLPERYQSLIERYTKDGPLQQVMVPADKFIEYFQTAGIPPEIAAEQFGVVNFAEAVAANSEVVIPMADFVAKIAPSDHLQGLLPDIRLLPGEDTIREAREAEANRDAAEAKLKEDLATFTQELDAGNKTAIAIERVVTDVEGQLRGRYDAETSRAMANAMRGAAVLAQRAYPDMDPMQAAEQLWGKYGLTIRANPLPDVLTGAPDFDAAIDPLLDRLRAGDVPKQTDIYGPSLFDFLRERGGVRDDGGELAARDAVLGDRETRRVGQRRLVSQNGMTFDEARELALQDGYAVGEDENSFLDAIDRELRGEPVFSQMNENVDLQNLTRDIDDIRQLLDEMGIDIGQADNAAIKQALQKELGGAAGYSQSANRASVTRMDEMRRARSAAQQFATDVDAVMAGSLRPSSLARLGETPAVLQLLGLKNLPMVVSQQEIREQKHKIPLSIIKDMPRLMADPVAVFRSADAAHPDRLVVVTSAMHGGGPVVAVVQPDASSNMGPVQFITSFHARKPADQARRVLSEWGGKGLLLYVSKRKGPVLEGAIGLELPKVQPEQGLAAKTILSDDDVFKAANSQALLQSAASGRGAGSPAGSSGTFGPEDQNSLSMFRQADGSTDDGARGSLQIAANRQMRLSLLEKADLSTFLHETGHFYLEVMGDLADDPGASQQVRDDYAAILKFLGAADRAGITTDMHEKWADANLNYLMEGKAPAPELRGVFQRFAAWLKLLFRKGAFANIKLTDEVRGVLDRIYATDEEIARAQAEAGLQDLFLDAQAAGMSEAEFDVYRAAIAEQTVEGKDELQAKLMRVERLKRETWWKEELEHVRQEVAAEYDATPAGQALERMSRKGSTERLRRAQLLERYGPEILKRLPRGYGEGRGAVYVADGHDIDAMAEVMGFDSANDMVEALAALPPRSKFVAAEADQRMSERYGDLLNSIEIADAAMEALHNGQREAVLQMELRALHRKMRDVAPFVKAERAKAAEQRRRAIAATSAPPLQAFRDMAAGMIGQKQVRDLSPHAFLLAERKASKAAFEAMAKGDHAAAFTQKQREILNHHLYLEATRAKAEARKIAEYLKGFGETKKRQALAKAGGEYLAQITALLERYEFTRASLKALERRESLAAWLNKLEADGEAVAVDERLRDETRKPTNWQQVPMDELRALRDAVKNLDHLARYKNKLIRKRKAIDFAVVVDELVAAAEASGFKDTGDLERFNDKGLGLAEKGAKAWRRFDAELLKIEQMISWLDGGKVDGPWARYVFDLADDAQTTEYDLHAMVTAKIQELNDSMPKAWRGSLFDDAPLRLRGFKKVNRYDLLSIALNMGNEGNLQRLRDGYGWTDGDLQAIRDTLTEDDMRFVQGIWDAIEALWPHMAALEERASGLPPPKVEAVPLRVAGQAWRGGYFPAAYDPKRSSVGERQVAEDDKVTAFFSHGFGRPGTNRGATKARAEHVEQPLWIDYEQVLSSHLAKVIKDVSHREAALGIHKILTNAQIKETLIEKIGEARYQQMRNWLQSLVTDRADTLQQTTRLTSALMKLRTNMAIVTMGFKVTTTLSQLAGIGPSLDLVKPRFFSKALIQSVRSPRETWAVIAGKSGEMRHRAATIDRDVKDSLLRMRGESGVHADVQRMAFFGVAMMDRVVSVPTWLGAYQQALADGKGEEDAIRAGDRAVRLSQGAGGAKDLSAVQRHNELMRLATMFYTPFNALYVRLRDTGHQVAIQGIGYLPMAAARVLALVILPSLLGAILTNQGPDDDEDPVWWAIRKMLLYPLASVPGIRDAAGYLEAGLIKASGEGQMKYAPTYRLIPVLDAITKIMSIPGLALDAYTGEKELDDAAWDIWERSGYLTGLPTAQTRITGEYLLDLLTGEAEPENVPEILRDALFRRPKEDR